MATVVLEAKSRSSVGTGASRAERREGFVPCSVYGDGKDPENIAISRDLLNKYARKSNFYSTVFEIEGIGKKGQKFVAKEVQFHPVTDQPIHVDFMRVGKGSRVAVRVPITFINEGASPGLKRGGVLNVLVHEMDVVCSPDDIPESISVDLTGFEFHHTVHAFDIVLPAGISLPHGCKNFTVATVVAPTIIKQDESEDAGDSAAAS